MLAHWRARSTGSPVGVAGGAAAARRTPSGGVRRSRPRLPARAVHDYADHLLDIARSLAQRWLAHLVRRDDGAPFTTRGKLMDDTRSGSAPPFTKHAVPWLRRSRGHSFNRLARRRAGSREGSGCRGAGSSRRGRGGPPRRHQHDTHYNSDANSHTPRTRPDVMVACTARTAGPRPRCALSCLVATACADAGSAGAARAARRSGSMSIRDLGAAGTGSTGSAGQPDAGRSEDYGGTPAALRTR